MYIALVIQVIWGVCCRSGVFCVRRQRGVSSSSDVWTTHRRSRWRAGRTHQLLPGSRLLRGTDRSSRSSSWSVPRHLGFPLISLLLCSVILISSDDLMNNNSWDHSWDRQIRVVVIYKETWKASFVSEVWVNSLEVFGNVGNHCDQGLSVLTWASSPSLPSSTPNTSHRRCANIWNSSGPESTFRRSASSSPCHYCSDCVHPAI